MKYLTKVEELVNGEIGDYSYYADNSEIETVDSDEGDYEYYELTIDANDDKIFCVTLRAKEDCIEVEVGEDIWYEVKDYDWTIKYFWIALLS